MSEKMTVERLTKLISEKAAQSGKPLKPGEELAAVCWFISAHEARYVLEDSQVKDFAILILEGEPLGGPYKTTEHVQEWIDFLSEDSDHSWDWLDDALDRHFGI